jgi:hypothetical protein
MHLRRKGTRIVVKLAVARGFPRHDFMQFGYNPICASIGGHLSFQGAAAS